ncbi:MAG: hypothetical protein RR493_07855, partial [Erysipelotrichaceae bacterium]
AGTDNIGIQGYDMVTQLGSNLKTTALSASLVNTQHIEIVRQNYGFDLERGINTVSIDPSTEHYYLEIRAVNENE